jgi:NADPH:quinone reductase
MRAIVYDRLGGPEVMELRDVPDPEPDQDEVLIEVSAAGVNFRDVHERQLGYPPSQPTPAAVIGIEGSGTIAETGERVGWVEIPGSYAERLVARRDQLVAIPDTITLEDAAAVLIQGMTAHFLTSDSYPIEAGDWVVVHSAAGGVGLLLTQLAKLRGGHVLATTSNAAKAALARENGADEVVGYDGFAARAKELTGNAGVAAVYDAVGVTTFAEGLDALRPGGRMILYGMASGLPDPLDLLSLADKSLFVQVPTLNSATRTPELLKERAAALFELIEAGDLTVPVRSEYPLAEARRAHEDLQGRRTTGKLVVTMD